MLYVGGHYVGTLDQNPGVLADYVRAGDRVELRDETGKQLGKVIPAHESPVPWDPTITEEEIQRRLTGPGLSFDEVKKRLGWE